MGHPGKKGSKFEKWVTLGRMGHKESVTPGKPVHILKIWSPWGEKGSYLEKSVKLGKMGHT